jgi:hypothetical protein
MKTVMLTLWIVALISALTVLTGCEATGKSDQMEPRWQKTASYETTMQHQQPPLPERKRTWAMVPVRYEAPQVTHFGSYFDDPLIYNGDGNDSYGWSWMEGAWALLGPARFVANTVAVPVSMVKEPPGVLQIRNLDQKIMECDSSE